jgi:hypothetical protein
MEPETLSAVIQGYFQELFAPPAERQLRLFDETC